MKDKILQLNAVLSGVDKSKKDPTVMNAKFLIHDFEVSWNESIISEQVCTENMHSLINKPIVAKYISQSENHGVDGLKGHEPTTDVLRNTDKVVMTTDTIAIGTITNTYIDTYVKDGESKRALFADAVLWIDKYPNICDLLVEWYERGIKINTSMELLYSNFSMVDGITNVLSPFYYTSHCLLQSEDKSEDGLPLVLPAYDDSQLISFNEIQQYNKLVAQAIDQKEKGGVMVAEVKETNEVVEPEQEETVAEEPVVDAESETVVTEETSVEEQSTEVTELRQENAMLQAKVTELETQLNEVSTKKEEVENKYVSLNEQVVQLNAQLEELKPFKEQHLQAQREAKLAEQTELYSGKFEAIGASDVFESEEVQSLLLASIEDGEKGLEAKRQLLEKLADSVKPIKVEKTETQSPIVQMSSKRGTLLENKEQDFDAKYSI